MTFDQHLEAPHRNEQIQPLRPFDSHTQCVIVAQIVELSGIFPFDLRDPQAFAAAASS
jgi:hypothetical protein